MKPLALQVARKQIAFVRSANDIHIFVQQALPLLERAKSKWNMSDCDTDRRYYVPARGKVKFAERTDAELKRIYDKFQTTGLYQAFLVTAVSQFESFLMDVLSLVFQAYPHKLMISVPGISAYKQLSIEVVLEALSLDEVKERMIREHVSGAFYASPHQYLHLLSSTASVDTEDSAFEDFIEIKATRDLIVHGEGKINSIYLSKVRENARGTLGSLISVDESYFDHCLATLKRCSGIIKRDIEKAFPNRKRDIA